MRRKPVHFFARHVAIKNVSQTQVSVGLFAKNLSHRTPDRTEAKKRNVAGLWAAGTGGSELRSHSFSIPFPFLLLGCGLGARDAFPLLTITIIAEADRDCEVGAERAMVGILELHQ